MNLQPVAEASPAQRHQESFDQHYQQWGYCRDIYEYLSKRADNTVLALYHYDSVKGTVADNLLIRNNLINVLDVGCGYGFFLQKLKSRYPYARLDMYGVDISRMMVENAKRNIPDARFYLCSAEQLPLDDDSFENVVCSEVIEHVVDPPQVIRELNRVTAPGGTVIISTPNYAGYTYVIIRLVEKLKRVPLLGGLRNYLLKHTDFSVRNEEIPLPRLREWMTDVGLDPIKVTYLAPFAEQKLLFPSCETLWQIMVNSTKFLERLPIINKLACNQLVIVARKL